MSRTKIPAAMRAELFDAAQHRTRPKQFQCAGCRRYFARPALQVDHIAAEVDSFPEDRLNVDNLQLLCIPKGSTRWNSCHKKKTAREAAARAAANRVPTQWWPGLVYGGLSVASAGGSWFYFQDDPDAALTWMCGSGGVLAGALSTKLVKNALERRRPRRKVQPEPELEPEPAPGLDLGRIQEAAREVMGPKGDVVVTSSGIDHFHIRYSKTGFLDSSDEKRLGLLLHLQAKIGERWRPTWETKSDAVNFHRRPTLERMVRHPGFDPGRPWNRIPIATGVDIDLLVTTHVLIVGTTGAGKTALMRSIIAAVADSSRKDASVQAILIDPKKIEMMGFHHWPGIKRVVSSEEDLWDIGFELEAEMHRRLDLITQRKAKPSSFTKLLVVLDEFEQYFKIVDRVWKTGFDEDVKPLKKGSGRVPPPIDAFQSVFSMARRVNIHVVLGTQSPDAGWFGGTGARQNLSGRIGVGPLDAIRARMMFDRSDIGGDIPVELKGRATVQVGDGEPQEIQCYFTPDPADLEGDLTEEDWEHLRMLGMETA